MAKGQQNVNSITVWMIIFVALWLTSTVFLVILYTGHEELRNENNRLAEANRQLISDAERNALSLVNEARPEGPTVVGLMERARSQTAELATGTATDDVGTVRTKRDQVVESIVTDRLVPGAEEFSGRSLLEALRLLYERFKANQLLLSTAEKRVGELDSEVTRLVEQNAQQKDDLDQRVNGLTVQLTEAEQSRTQYRGDRDAAVAGIKKDYEERLSENDAALRRERQRLATLERDNEALRRRFEEQWGPEGGGPFGLDELSAARQPDGSILLAVPGDDVVYIDLGADDRLVRGLQFSVFSRDVEHSLEGGRPKAVIEVVSISPASAECRVARVSPGSVIVEGDSIANPMYDRSRALSFLTLGEFDLDHDGRPDPDGAETIHAMILAWGGTVSPELSAGTDFVIVGRPPRQPRPTTDSSGDQAERQRAAVAWDQFQQVIASARSLAVPIMNQDVFSMFLGGTPNALSR